ncbi:MAG: hypothetical protein GY913_17705 [Proteobacteria bacterium]|nr:hypothetical protein [Pseudomonadota bacterium]MCP4918742.1 hypothetical protein [Pseudomonadota bacterium]
MLWISLAYAGSAQTDFDEEGLFPGAVEGGNLVVTDSSSWTLEQLLELEGQLRLRLTEGDQVSVSIGSESWTAAYTEGGGVGVERHVVHTPSHRAWVPDAVPTIEPDGEWWDGNNTLHCDVLERDGTTRLYWTGEMTPGYAYRQIGFATSVDLQTWTESETNPVLTIDYNRETIDGIHVHMPTVVEQTGAWTMLYSCYQNDLGNRLCRATSDDGEVWSPQGIALDFGGTGEFDEGSLRMPEMWVGDDGTWHVLYNGTEPGEHYGPTGYATSPDGVTWTKQGAITDDENLLQGGGLVRTPYGLEQVYNVDAHFETAIADPADPSVWTPLVDTLGESLTPDRLPDDYGAGYIQAPTLLDREGTLHMWFNAYGADADATFHERLWHARSVPQPGAWYDLAFRWDGESLWVEWTDDLGLVASQTVDVAEVDTVTIQATGRAEVDSASLSWTQLDEDLEDSGTPTDSDPAGDSETDSPSDSEPTDPPSEEEEGCGGCGGGVPSALGAILAMALLRRRVDGEDGIR